MAAMKEKKRNSRQKDEPERHHVSGEAVRGVVAILFFAVAGALVFAAFGLGGTVGSATYEGLTWLLGVGYMLLPLSLILVSILIFRALEKSVSWVQLVSMGIFLLSALAMVNLAFAGKGGVLGYAISHPIVVAVDVPVTVIFLFAFIIVSLIIAFDIHLSEVLSALREWATTKSPEEIDEIAIEDVPVVGLPE